MINGISTTTDIANIEHMIVMGKATPEGEVFTSTVMREDLTPEQQGVYDAGVALVSGNFVTTIDNTTSELTITRMTSDVVSEDEGVFDFTTMSEGDQDILRDLLALFVELKD